LNAAARKHPYLTAVLIFLVFWVAIMVVLLRFPTFLGSVASAIFSLALGILFAILSPLLSSQPWFRWPLPPYPNDRSRIWGLIGMECLAVSFIVIGLFGLLRQTLSHTLIDPTLFGLAILTFLGGMVAFIVSRLYERLARLDT
jgi:hypothetical protein